MMQSVSWKIGIDCRLAGKKHAGIGRYTENLVQNLIQLESKHPIKWVLFFHDEKQARAVLAKNWNQVKVVIAPIKHYTLKEQILLPKLIGQEKLDLLHVPHFNIPVFYRGKLVVTIHDLLWHEFKGAKVTTLPAWQYWLKYQMYLFTVRQAVSRAVQIIVPSKTVATTLEQYYPTAQSKTSVIYEGASLANIPQQSSAKFDSQLDFKKPSLLYVGSLYPHKNIQLVLEALKKLPDLQLLVVGTRDVFQNQVKHKVAKMGISSQVKFFGYVTDEELSWLFGKSLALVQPSLFEGFGLTGVEAMQQGLPVLASDIPIFREIYEDAASLFDPYSVESFIQSLNKVKSQTSRSQLISKGKNLARRYNWKKMAEHTLELYENILTTAQPASPV